MKPSFKVKNVTKDLLSVLQDRARDVVERRFGLVGTSGEKMTLEAIGQVYGITRERVRQIENFAVAAIRKSEAYTKALTAFEELVDAMAAEGGFVNEQKFLEKLSNDPVEQNQIHFLLTLGDQFIRIKENDHFHHRWTVSEDLPNKVESAVNSLRKELGRNDLISEDDITVRFLEHLKAEIEEMIDHEQARRWLDISKRIAPNPLGEWGLADSPNVRMRGMRDYAYLVLRDEGEPLHFSDVASRIENQFNRKAHVATCHNELIKDDRFVLVGRGLYALSEWGYTNGIVRDVISTILKKKSPLSKDEIIKEVLKQRQVRENTIYVNLQNNRYFKKDKAGKYSLA